MSRAIITVKQTNSYWHPLWERYYLPHFDHTEVMTIESDKHPPSMVTWKFITHMVNDALDRMLKIHDLVMLADIDEIIVPDPEKYHDLSEYLDCFGGDAIRTKGYNVVESPEDEPFDIDKPVTSQREYWSRELLYDKPALTRVPFIYTVGQHHCTRIVDRDDDLVLFHLRDANRASAIKRRSTNINGYDERLFASELIPEKWRII